MPTTRQNIGFLKDLLPNYSREQILARYNEVHRIVYSSDSEQFIYIDPSTGLPPYLATTAGVYSYTAPSNCRRTLFVYTRDQQYRNLSRQRPIGPRREYYFSNRGYHEVPVRTVDRTAGTDPTVIFEQDPGTSTDKYLHLYTIEPNEIETLEDELQIPEHLHYLVRDIVVQMFASEEYGVTERKHVDLERGFRKIRSEMNRGAQARLSRTPWREEHQSWDNAGYFSRLG